MVDIAQVKRGMAVYSADGKRLGKVVSIASSSFQVQKGLLVPRELLVFVGDVRELRDDGLVLRVTASQATRDSGTYHLSGREDLGHAGDPRTGPVAGVGAGLAAELPPNEAVALAREQSETGRTDAGIAGDGGHRDEVLGGWRREAPGPATAAPLSAADDADATGRRTFGVRPDDDTPTRH